MYLQRRRGVYVLKVEYVLQLFFFFFGPTAAAHGRYIYGAVQCIYSRVLLGERGAMSIFGGWRAGSVHFSYGHINHTLCYLRPRAAFEIYVYIADAASERVKSRMRNEICCIFGISHVSLRVTNISCCPVLV